MEPTTIFVLIILGMVYLYIGFKFSGASPMNEYFIFYVINWIFFWPLMWLIIGLVFLIDYFKGGEEK